MEPFDINKGSNFAWQSYIDNPGYALKKNRPIQLVQMSPDRYIEEVAKGFSGYGKIVTPEELISQRTNENMRNIMEAMKKGEKFPTPFIEYPQHSTINQEGLHRAVAAKNLGIKNMPVYIQQIGKDYGDNTETIKRLARRASKYGPIIKKLFSAPLDPYFTIPDMLQLQSIDPRAVLDKNYRNRLIQQNKNRIY